MMARPTGVPGDEAALREELLERGVPREHVDGLVAARPVPQGFARAHEVHRAQAQEQFMGNAETLGSGNFVVEILRSGPTAMGDKVYPVEVLRDAAARGVYENAWMYLGHSDTTEEKRRGHRDLEEWAGMILPGTVELKNGALWGKAHIHNPTVRQMLEDAVACRAVGLSCDHEITYTDRYEQGRRVHYVERIERAHSVDFVPAGNASGGAVLPVS